eukprot:scaffold18284_cov39-Cyclotella_meneghiniana.AAC.1
MGWMVEGQIRAIPDASLKMLRMRSCRNGQLLANIGRDNNQYCQRRNNVNQLTCMGRCSKQTLESGQLTDCSKSYYCGISNRSVHMQTLRHEQGWLAVR